jgi:hypothetical protein
MVGRAVNGLIVWTPLPILNAIISRPPVAFASRIACRKEPAPASLVLLTVNVAADANELSPKIKIANENSFRKLKAAGEK